ncbi:hypothetical protein G6L91_11475 [Agrobacterium rhizogenes]|uniref:hypothetical protein n=1 Tax=Rhizobium rhizogenes TaxID=359 RepID=UPI001572661C|nr:hypothetical protein [Rhizobium rhizogenes]NTF62087.1 hypothetical protein [Rhizobium rhizogenes]
MPTKVTVYRCNGETADLDSSDARTAVRNHPDEWSFTLFSAEQQAAAQADPSIEARPIVASENRGPFN